MRTIRIELTDKEMPPPTGNPLTLRAADDSNLTFGDIRYIKTGIRFFIPSGIETTIRSCVPGLVVIGSQQNDLDGDLQLVVLCCGMQTRIGRMQAVATMSIFEMKPAPVRFAVFSDGGKRVMFGGGEKIENSTDIPSPKP